MSDWSGHRADAGRRRGRVDLRLDELFGSAGRRHSTVVTEPRHVPAAFGGSDGGGPDGDGPDGDGPDGDGPDGDGPDDGVGDPGPRGGRRTRGSAPWDHARRITRWRIDPERRGAVAVLGAILVAALAVGWQALAGRPHSQPVADSTRAAVSNGASFTGSNAPIGVGTVTGVGVTAPAATAAPTTTSTVIVDVVGRVHRPGLVTLPAGARVADAVRAAGGALAGTNLSSINLARVCIDGEQIAVGVPGAIPPAGATASAGSSVPGALVNLNTATADQLDALPGVGPVLAQRIIAYRTDHGPFTSVEQLQQVSGIGTAKFADLSPLVTV